MRLPSDAALILVDLQLAIDDARWGPRNNPGAERAIVALLAAWREEGLPIVHIRHDSVEPHSPYRPDRPSHAFKPETAPLPGEAIVAKSAHSAFVDGALEQALDSLGATTLVICGVLTHNSVEATARHAADLGYRVFVVADACWAVALADGAGGFWPAEIVHRVALACLAGEYAAIVDTDMALAAARLARTRLRMKGADSETGR
jgi:nicotinamidase-related amidase